MRALFLAISIVCISVLSAMTFGFGGSVLPSSDLGIRVGEVRADDKVAPEQKVKSASESDGQRGGDEKAARLNGEKLFGQRCASCHVISPPLTLAPPVFGIVRNYSQTFRTEDRFAQAVGAFIHNSSGVSLMPRDRERFDNMPTFSFEKNELEAIARWMWRKVNSANNLKENCECQRIPVNPSADSLDRGRPLPQLMIVR